MTNDRRSGWVWAWLVWLAAFLVIEIPAAILTPDAVGTLSVHVWGRWFPEPWARGVFLLFWTVVGIHFANRGRRWYADGRAVAITGALAGLVALWHELRRRFAVGDKDDLGDALGAPWYVRLGLKLGRGGIVKRIKGLFEGKPGLLRTVLALFVLTMATLPVLGPKVGQVVGAIGSYLGLAAQAVGVPVDPQALADAFEAWWLATLALVALLRPVVRWVIAGFSGKDLGEVSPSNPSLKG